MLFYISCLHFSSPIFRFFKLFFHARRMRRTSRKKRGGNFRASFSNRPVEAFCIDAHSLFKGADPIADVPNGKPYHTLRPSGAFPGIAAFSLPEGKPIANASRCCREQRDMRNGSRFWIAEPFSLNKYAPSARCLPPCLPAAQVRVQRHSQLF